MSNYGTAIDKKWQKKWEETELYKFNPDAEGKKTLTLSLIIDTKEPLIAELMVL